MTASAHRLALADELARLRAGGLQRTLVPLDGPVDAEVTIDGRRLLMLASNSYLGIAAHPALRAATAAAAERYGAGTGAARLVAGDLTMHHELEHRLARFKGTEAALLFTSGYHANIGTIPALVGPDDDVFSDALNHASIVDGCRLARARISVYPHRDVSTLERRLAEAGAARRRLIVTDSVFSMDGDVAPLADLAALAARFDAWLMVDEAHATGVLGPTGAGLGEALGLVDRIDVHMGTLGKALGGFGAYVAGSHELIALLINRARSFIYTTGLPATIAAAALAALDVVDREPERRATVLAHAKRLRDGLVALGYAAGGETHIVPLIVGDNAAALALAEAVIARGVFVRAIRPPTVPEGTARLRLTPMASHTTADIDRALDVFSDAGRALGLLPSAPVRASRAVASSPEDTPPPAPLPGNAPAAAATDGLGAANAATLAAWDHRYLWHPFTQMSEWLATEPLVIAAGDGNYLIDVEGRRYLDGVSSLWCNVHGHRRPEIDAAIQRQLERVAHSTLLGLSSEPAILLARALVTRAPRGLSRVFYSDAGATAVEIALRMTLQFWQLRGATERTAFASLVGGYHGDTLGAVGVGYSETFHRFVRDAVRPALRLRPPHVFRWEQGLDPAAALDAALAEAARELETHQAHLAALIVEPLMQGAAGMWAHPIEYLAGLRALTRRHDMLLICDEVATGFGRTGALFACGRADIAPDLLCLGKGLSGGYLPLAATLATEEIFSAFLGRYEDYVAFFHGHTFTGNALACAAGIASLDIFDCELVLDRIPALAARLAARLADLSARVPAVGDVRQWGLMAGVELVADRTRRTPYPVAARVGARVCQEARRHGVILRPLGDVLVLMPPLSITPAEIDTLVDVAAAAIARVVTTV